MPNKGRKIASRQAQVRDKKKRGRAAPQVFEAGPVQPAAPVDDAEEEAPPLQPTPAIVQARASVSKRRSRATEPVAGYKYLGTELRRIGLITSLIVVILVALTVLLR